MKTRIIHTKFWTDTYIRRLEKIDEKYLFFYLITNEFINIIALFELPFDIVSQQTGVEENRVKEVFEKFAGDNKIKMFGEYIYLTNAYKYQYYKGSKNNHLKLRLVYELNNETLKHFSEEVIEIFNLVSDEHKHSDKKDEKITNLLSRVKNRLIDRGIYTPIHTSSDTGYKPEIINDKPENKNQNTETINKNSDGYKKFQSMRDLLAKK